MERPPSHRTSESDNPLPDVSGTHRPCRILIVRIGAMGDVLHALSAVTSLREAHPDWLIAWAIEPRWSELLQSAGDLGQAGAFEARTPGKPLVDIWCSVPARRWKKQPLTASTFAEIRATRELLRAWDFDLCVDMQGSIKSAVIGRMAGAKVFAGASEPRERPAAWLYDRRFPLHAGHVIDQGCELLSAATGETLLPAKVNLPVDEAAEQWCDAVLADVSPRSDPFVLIAPAAA